METSWVGEREDDGAVDVRGHFSNDFLSEGFGFGRGADEDVGFYFFDYGE